MERCKVIAIGWKPAYYDLIEGRYTLNERLLIYFTDEERLIARAQELKLNEANK